MEDMHSKGVTTNEYTETCHRCLGHLNEANTEFLRSKPELDFILKYDLKPCETYKLCKSAQRRHPKASELKYYSPYELIYTDLAELFKPRAQGGLMKIVGPSHTRRKKDH